MPLLTLAQPPVRIPLRNSSDWILTQKKKLRFFKKIHHFLKKLRFFKKLTDFWDKIFYLKPFLGGSYVLGRKFMPQQMTPEQCETGWCRYSRGSSDTLVNPLHLNESTKGSGEGRRRKRRKRTKEWRRRRRRRRKEAVKDRKGFVHKLIFSAMPRVHIRLLHLRRRIQTCRMLRHRSPSTSTNTTHRRPHQKLWSTWVLFTRIWSSLFADQWSIYRSTWNLPLVSERMCFSFWWGV